jgi:hypothetical protein
MRAAPLKLQNKKLWYNWRISECPLSARGALGGVRHL